jgi:cytochrome c oxidase cbb3-type subunit 3/ubiquinol-cytochrome c reductase cytochrome c subunit
MNSLKRNSAPRWLAASIIFFVIAGCRSAPGKPGPDPEVPRPEQVLDFPTLYAQNCAACHGVYGLNGAAISLNNPAYLAIAGSANIQRITANGVPGTSMPAFAKSAGGTLTDQQIVALTNGMEKKWASPSDIYKEHPPYAASALGIAANGQKTFTSYCASCHGPDATGARLPARLAIPNNVTTGSLVDPSYLALISDQGLRSVILAGQFEYDPPHGWLSYSPGHDLTDQEITDIVAWLASHRTATPGQVYQQHP